MEKISEIIKSRIQSVGRRFHSNDNISEFMYEGDLEKLQQEVEEKFQSVLNFGPKLFSQLDLEFTIGSFYLPQKISHLLL